MKVANVIEEARIGGPQKRMLLIALGLLAQRDIQTTIIFPTWGGAEYEDLLQENNVDYKRIALTKLNRDVKGAIKYISTFVKEVKALSCYFKDAGFDLVHASGGSWQYKAVIAAKWAGIPVVWHLNDTSMNALIKHVFNIVARRYPDAFIIAGERVREYYLDNQSFGLTTFLIPAPVDTAVYRPLDSKNIKDSHTRHKVVCVGNINPVKGYDHLFKALLLLDNKNIKIDVDICGGRFSSQAGYIKMVDELADQLQNVSVTFHGVQKNTLTFLQNADIFICSSIAEASPMAVWEAMSTACPIVTTDVGDVSLHIENGVSGLIVPPSDPRALAAAIEEMLNAPEQAKIMGEQARLRAEVELGVEEIVRLQALCYENILTVSR